MIITIDRFEGEYAVVESPDGKIINIPKVIFADAREGDRFEIQKVDNKDNEALFNKLFE